MNAFGQYTQYMQNNILTEKTYNAFGMPEHSMAGNFFHFQNDWNVNTGNLETRTNHISDNTESFTYDNLNRLTFSQTINGNGTQQDGIITSYFPNGNIQFKSRIGTYSYDGDKLNAVDHVPNTSGDISGFIQDITYTTFNKCSTITENNKVLTLTYGPDQQRRKSILTDNGAEIKNIIYSRNYEKITIKDPNDILPDKTYEVHYISCGAGLVSIAVKEDGGTPKFFNVYTDHLGSIVKITNSHNNVIYEQNFDAWGRERNPTDWSYSDNTNNKPEWLIRGFTGHEHLDEFALINMNGRVYDPLLGRFNSPDNHVQNPFGTQFYNRYSYGLNNPLVYVDPSGELIGAFIGAIIGAYLGGVTTNQGELNPLQWNWDKKGSWKTYTGIIVGGGIGALGGHVAQYWITHAGTVSLKAGFTGGGGGVFAVGQGSNWSLQWTSAAGGGGQVPISGQTTSGPSINMTEVNAARGTQPPMYQFGSGNSFNLASNDYYASTMGGADEPLLVNPSGGVIRGADQYGSGYWGATRGDRMHKRLDITTTYGQDIVSPFTGTATNYYGATTGYPMVDITPKYNLGIDKVRILYVNPLVGAPLGVPYSVSAGQQIGTASYLPGLGYPKGITSHIHLQLMSGGNWINPTPYFFK